MKKSSDQDNGDPGVGKKFKPSVESTRLLKWRAGLQAIKKGEGAGKIKISEEGKLKGSVNIDDDCREAKEYKSSNRWDYAIGVQESDTADEVYYVEVHGADTSKVSDVEKKLQWLKAFLMLEENKGLAKLKRTYVWVKSGGFNIPQHTPQYKRLKAHLQGKLGLIGPDGTDPLVLPLKR